MTGLLARPLHPESSPSIWAVTVPTTGDRPANALREDLAVSSVERIAETVPRRLDAAR